MNWRRIPFVRLLLPFLLGILTAFYAAQTTVLWLALAFLPALFIPLFILSYKEKLKPKSTRFFGVLAFCWLFLAGYSLCYLHHELHYPQHFQAQIADQNTILTRITSSPKLYSRSLRCQAQIEEIQDSSGLWHSCQGKLLMTIQLDSHAANLQTGDLLIAEARLNDISAAKNPKAFDAKGFYANKNIYQQTYLASGKWQKTTDSNPGVWSMVEGTRDYLLSLLQKHLPTENEYAVGSALILGDKGGLKSEIRNAYADTGAMHVLAVSGLHVGLIAWLFSWFLALVPIRSRLWVLARTLVLVLLIWIFALITGGSPSVLRASTMFSLLIIGQALARQTNIYNTLAASAFILLCFDPFSIFDLGFQLSYCAVLGIVYLQPRIYGLWKISNKLGDWIWKLTCVSLAAQLATLPLSLFYFHQFPLFFWLSGLIVIPMATLILPLGLLTMFFSFWAPLANLFGTLLYWAIWLMNALIFAIRSLPFAVIEGIWIEAWEMWLWYFLIGSLLWAIYRRSLKGLYLPLCLGLGLGGFQIVETIQQHGQAQVVVYHAYKGTVIDFVQGRQVLTLADSAQLAASKRTFTNQNYLWSIGAHQQELKSSGSSNFQNDFVSIQQAFIKYQNTTFALLSPPLVYHQHPQPIEVDYAIICGNPTIWNLQDLNSLVHFDHLIFDASNSPWRLQKWKEQCKALNISFTDINEQGALVLRF